MQANRRLIGLVGVWAAVSFFVVYKGDGRNGFWVHHPMLGALVSGLLLFAIGALVINSLLESRAAKRWSRIAHVGYVHLAIQTRDALSTLWGTHSGPDLGGVSRAIHLRLTPARELKSDLPGKEAVAAFDRAPHWDIPEGGFIPSQRLDYLLHDRDWLTYARPFVESLTQRLQSTTTDWAGHMIWAPEPRRLLNHFADFGDQLTRLHGALNILYYNLGDAEIEENNRRRVLAHWELAEAKGRILLNALWAAAGWRQRMLVPTWAETVGVDEAFKWNTRVGKQHPVHIPDIRELPKG